MIDFRKEAEEVFARIVAIRRDIHMHPEPSKEEFRTADLAAKEMEALGLEVRRDMADELPSVVAVLKGGKPGPTIALRADMDALRIVEKNDLPFKSQNEGIMHACGHDAHVATLIGAAEVLAKHKEELPGTIKFIFEPAEEDIGGAQFMIKNGVLDDVEAVFGLHVENQYPVGTIGVCHGEMQASSDRISIKIKGKSAHGAYPHRGIDAIMIAAHFLTSVQTMMAREKDTFGHAIITFGMIHGGASRNIVCEEVELGGIIRTLNPDVREFLNERVEGLLKGITMAFGGDYELVRHRSHPALYSDPTLTDHVIRTAESLLGKDKISEMEHALLICESFAYFAQAKPGAFFFLGTGNKETGKTEALHNSGFDIDENAILNGIMLHAKNAWDYLSQRSGSN